MVVVGVSRDQRSAIVGSPEYFKSHPKPNSPHDLPSHRCINFRHGSAGVYRWEFDKGDQPLAVAVNGPLIVDDVELMTRAAIDGVGLAFMSEEHAAPHLASGALVRVLEDWCPPYAGYFLYYPSRRQQPAALWALIETLRLEL
jgi:DNA-binding transcriptional LysR family regulator